MTQTVDTCADSDRAAEIRNVLTDQLRSDGMITSPVVERAFRTVPRHLFVPEDTPLEVAYNADDSVATKREQDGVIISSISAPFIQAQMLVMDLSLSGAVMSSHVRTRTVALHLQSVQEVCKMIAPLRC